MQAIADAGTGTTDAALAALDALRAAPQTTHALRDVVGRWRAGELVVRRAGPSAPDRATWVQSLLGRLRRPAAASASAEAVQAAVREASDHPVLRLVTWIALLRQPDDGRREVVRDYHDWVIAGLEREGVAGIEPLAEEWRRRGDEATLSKIIALFGGNRGKTCTVVEDGRLRALALRTARQEAVEMQRRLREDGLDATLRAFDQLAAEWPRLVVFRTYSAELRLWAGRYDEAAALFDEVRRNSVNRWAHVGLGRRARRAGQFAEAEKIWDEGLRVHRGALAGEASQVYRAEVAMAAGRLDEADGLLRRVLGAAPTRLRARLGAAGSSPGCAATPRADGRPCSRPLRPARASPTQRVPLVLADLLRVSRRRRSRCRDRPLPLAAGGAARQLLVVALHLVRPRRDDACIRPRPASGPAPRPGADRAPGRPGMTEMAAFFTIQRPPRAQRPLAVFS